MLLPGAATAARRCGGDVGQVFAGPFVADIDGLFGDQGKVVKDQPGQLQALGREHGPDSGAVKVLNLSHANSLLSLTALYKPAGAIQSIQQYMRALSIRQPYAAS